jgi:hypothetical protein
MAVSSGRMEKGFGSRWKLAKQGSSGSPNFTNHKSPSHPNNNADSSRLLIACQDGIDTVNGDACDADWCDEGTSYHRAHKPHAARARRPPPIPSETRGRQATCRCRSSSSPRLPARGVGKARRAVGHEPKRPAGGPPTSSQQQPGRGDQRPRGLRVTRDEIALAPVDRSGHTARRASTKVALTPWPRQASLAQLRPAPRVRWRGRPGSRFVRGSLPIDRFSAYPPRASRQSYVRALK